jgi:hypothetical protein
VRRDSLGEQLHDLDLGLVVEQRQVAPRHELDRNRNHVANREQGVDELAGRAGVRGPAQGRGRQTRAYPRGLSAWAAPVTAPVAEGHADGGARDAGDGQQGGRRQGLA